MKKWERMTQLKILYPYSANSIRASFYVVQTIVCYAIVGFEPAIFMFYIEWGDHASKA